MADDNQLDSAMTTFNDANANLNAAMEKGESRETIDALKSLLTSAFNALQSLPGAPQYLSSIFSSSVAQAESYTPADAGESSASSAADVVAEMAVNISKDIVEGNKNETTTFYGDTAVTSAPGQPDTFTNIPTTPIPSSGPPPIPTTQDVAPTTVPEITAPVNAEEAAQNQLGFVPGTVAPDGSYLNGGSTGPVATQDVTYNGQNIQVNSDTDMSQGATGTATLVSENGTAFENVSRESAATNQIADATSAQALANANILNAGGDTSGFTEADWDALKQLEAANNTAAAAASPQALQEQIAAAISQPTQEVHIDASLNVSGGGQQPSESAPMPAAPPAVEYQSSDPTAPNWVPAGFGPPGSY